MPEWITKAGLTAYPLILCSLISLAIVVERCLFWMRHRSSWHLLLRDKIVSYVGQGRLEDARQAGKDSQDYLVRIYLLGLNHHKLSLRGALEMGIEYELKKMTCYLSVLDTIITLAPLLGILGTILGVITSFDVLGAAGLEDPKLVTGGIAEALISTAMGLGITIVTLIPFNFFQSLVERRVSEMEIHVTNFELMYTKGTGN